MNGLLKEAISEIDVNEVFKTKLKERIKDTIEDVVAEQVGHWGEFKKSFEKAVKEQMKFDPNKLDLSNYTNFVSDQCVEILNECMSEEKAMRIKNAFKEKLNITAKEEWEFDDLVQFLEDTLEEVVKDAMEDDPCGCDDLPRFTIECKKHDNYSWFDLTVYEGDPDDYGSRYAQLTISDDGKCLSCHTKSNMNKISRMFQAMAYRRTMIHNIDSSTRVEIKREHSDYY